MEDWELEYKCQYCRKDSDDITVMGVVELGIERDIFFDTNSMLMSREEVVGWYHRLKDHPDPEETPDTIPKR